MKKQTTDSRGRDAGARIRILDAAIVLFAEQGFRDTTVGAIESAAGLAPRSGALYQHFGSKDELARACVQRQVGELARMQDAMEMLPLGDLRAELLLMGRWNLADLSRRQPLYRFISKEGDRFPDLREQVVAAIVEKPLIRVASWLGDRARESGVDGLDCEALTLVIVQSMASYRWLETLCLHQPIGVDEQRFLNAWVDTALAVLERSGIVKQQTTA